MCGIFGYIGNKNQAAKIVFEGIKSLEYRGYDSWGVAVIPTTSSQFIVGSSQKINNKFLNSPIIIKKKVGKIGNATVNELPQGNIAIGHTRWATHGGVTEINAHPHLDCSKSLALIHNGIIENYSSFKKKLITQGHIFLSETDTEVAVHLIEEYAKIYPLRLAVRKAFNDLEGLSAIIILSSKTREIIAVRNGSPLIIGMGENENYLSSDVQALIPHTRRVYFLKDNELAVLTPTKVEYENVLTGTNFQPKIEEINWTFSQTTLGDFPHFMLKEIYEQPSIISEITTRSQEHEKLASIIKKANGTYMVGCGSAAYVGIAGNYLFSKISKLHINTSIGSEFGYQLDFLTHKSLVIALSQSGETMDTLVSVKKAKAKGAKIAALVNVLGSTLYREADFKILIGAGPEKAVASTKALTGKLAHLTLLAYALAGKINQGQKVISIAVKSTQELLKNKSIELMKKLAGKLKSIEHIYVIGRGLSYPAALETAIKIKEITYIHAEGMAAGELKHGPLALIEKGSICIAFLPNDETYGANLAGAMEMKARGGIIIGISYMPHEIFDYYVHVTEAREATIIPNIIVGQLLAYYIAIERGLDPDKPRNLAKSVTVK